MAAAAATSSPPPPFLLVCVKNKLGSLLEQSRLQVEPDVLAFCPRVGHACAGGPVGERSALPVFGVRTSEQTR